MEKYMRSYAQDGFVPRSYSNKKPPLGTRKPTIPEWEKKFCKIVGSLNWHSFLEKKKYVHMYDNILEWDDSAGEEAFHSAKRRFWAELNGFTCAEDIPNPDLYIDEIDWECQIDEDLVLDLDCISITVSDEKRDRVIIFGDSFIKTLPFFSNGFGTGWGDEMPEATGWGAEMPEATGWGDEIPKATGWGAEMPEATGWGDEIPKATGWGTEMPEATGWGDEIPKATGWGTEMPEATGWGDEIPKATGWGAEMPEATGWGDEMPEATRWGDEMPKATGWGEEMPKGTGWGDDVPEATGWGYEEDTPKDHDKENRAGDSWHLNTVYGWSSGWDNFHSRGMKREADINSPKNRNSDYGGSWRWDNNEPTRTNAGKSWNKAPRFHGDGHNANLSWKGRNQGNYSWRRKNTGKT